MSKQLRLNFIFTCFGNLFIAGNKAKGVLKVFTDNETRITRVKIGVVGKIIMEADEEDNPTALEQVFYCSEEHIFNPSDFVVNDDYDEQLLEYVVPLANNLPPSIVLPGGSITYHLYATMEEEFPDGTSQNVNTEANISIVRLVDCNTIPKAAKDKVANGMPVTGCFCLTRRETDDSLQISPRAYVPGDCIKINAVVFNSESCPMSYVQVALVQKVKLKFEDRTVKKKQVVSETKHGCLMPQDVQVWHDQLLRIPPLPCTTDHKHLYISYKLKLIPVKQNVDISCAKPLLSVPVVIGNLPLESSLAYFNPLPRCETFETSMLPIPTPYQEFARVEFGILANNDGSKFIPSYITYVTERAMDNIELP